MTYRTNYTRSVGLYTPHGSGSYKTLGKGATAGTLICYSSFPKDITTRDIIHIRTGVTSVYGVAATMRIMIHPNDSFDTDDVLQSIDITVNTTDSSDFPVHYAQFSPHADVVTEVGNDKGLRIYGKATTSIAGWIQLQGFQAWVEKRP